jgi:zinc transport system substrate-binding protein
MLITVLSCGRKGNEQEAAIITVSIPPFKYFVEGIAGDQFKVNVMVPPGANPHIYEPTPDQILNLRRSVAYISDGYLGFESIWLDRFYEVNRQMKRLSLSESIDPIYSEDHNDGDHNEIADPHYWVSPSCAQKMALALKQFLTELTPENNVLYEANYKILKEKIMSADAKAAELETFAKGRAFMIYHPNLAYLARDYGLQEISVEYEGKEPSALRLKELIDLVKRDSLKVILIQKEYDTKNARVISEETSLAPELIDPLSEDWLTSVTDIIEILSKSFEKVD